MKRCLRIVAPVIVLITVAICCAFPHPIRDQAQLQAIAAESQHLLARYPLNSPAQGAEIPRDQWPPAIAKLKPYSVTVRHGMVDIATKPFLDGGWGYGYTLDKQDLTMLVECWSELGHGMYWHGPC